MNVSLTSFINPFSFFCIPENEHVKSPKNGRLIDNYAVGKPKKDFTQLVNGQYIAVLHNNDWVRGIVSLENQVLIWLVDNGMYLRPNQNTVFKELPESYKKLPSKVFEASLHGIVPVRKTIEGFSEIKAVESTVWAKGATEQAKELFDKAVNIRFEPLALISSNQNDVVIGDLYLNQNGLNYVNIIDVLDKLPMYLKRDREFYIENLPKIYSNHRHHHACSLKPQLPGNIPTFDINDLNIQKYNSLCENVPKHTLELQDDAKSDTASDDGSDLQICLTPSEIEEFSTKCVIIDGKEVNILHLLKNKARDFTICAKYKNLKSVGRASTKRNFYD